jgi:hypothetical protein
VAATSGTTGTSGTGSLVDASVGDALSDAAVIDQIAADQGPPPPRVLTCQMTQAVPRLLDDFHTLTGAARTLNDGLAVQAVGNGTSVRILAQQSGNATDYLEYFASDVPSGMGAQTITSFGRVVDVRKKDANTTSVLVINQGDPGMPAPQPAELDLHQFNDSMSSSMPTIVPLTTPNQLGTSGGGNIEARFWPAADGSIALAASFQLPTGIYHGEFGMYAGSPAPLLPLQDDPNPDVVRPQAVVKIPTGASYVFTNQANPTEFEMKDGQMPQSRTIPGNAFVVDASMSSNGRMNVIMADFGTSLSLYVGQIDPAQAMTFDSTQLALAKQAASVTEVPFSQPSISGDQLFMLGPTGAGRELSLLWVDMAGHTRASQKLTDTVGLVKAGVIVPRDAFGSTLGGKFHVVWVERLGDSNGDYDQIFYDQMQCL